MVPEAWVSKVAENCVGADVLAERGLVCISKEQLDHCFLRNTQEAAFQHIVFYRHCVINVEFRSKRVFHCEAVSHSEFLPYSEHVLRGINGARTLVF